MAKNPVVTPKAKASGGDDARLKLIRERAERAMEFDRQNIKDALYDLEFRAGLNQWPEAEEHKRIEEGRPVIIENRIPQFVRQVTGDMRQMKPAMKAYPVDDSTDVKKAELVTEILRFIEIRSDATDAYFKASDSQVACGIGHWRIVSEYCDDEGNAQDLLIQSVDDQVNVLWDPDATKANREDAAYCFVPVDMTLALFKDKYPDAGLAEFDTLAEYRTAHSAAVNDFWCSGETIRVAEYWERKEVIDKETKRKRYKVTRSIVTGSEVLEGPEEWPGKYIPIIPLIGEEVRIGGRVYRHGVVRFLRTVQQRLNYFLTAETEVVALQPKSPFMATDKQVEDHLDQWNAANRSNQPFLTYTPDPRAPGAPQRVPPAVSSQGILDGIKLATDGMYSVTGIYPSSLGGKSNESSGKAILARQREGDVGTYVYINNFERALKHTGRILVDLIPRFYDTARVLRIFGDDGAINEIKINQPGAGVIEAPEGVDPEQVAQSVDPATDLTIGQHDVIVRASPPYTTAREEARETLKEFMADPKMKALLGDLYVGLLDVPGADKWAKRLKAILPPPIQQQEAEEAGEGEGGAPMAAPIPPPEIIAKQVEQQIMQSADMQLKQADLAIKAAQARKAEADAMKAEMEVQMLAQSPVTAIQQPDPMQEIERRVIEKRAMTQVDLEAEMYRRKMGRDIGQVVEMGMGEEAVEPTPMGATPVELLAQGLMQQGAALQQGLSDIGAGLQALAASQMAPTELIRDGIIRPIGAQGDD